MKTGWPLTKEKNLKYVGSKLQIMLPSGEFVLGRYTTPEQAEKHMNELNKEAKRKGGRPNKEEKKEKVANDNGNLFEETKK